MKSLKKNKQFIEHTFLPDSIKLGYQDIKILEVDAIDDTQGSYRCDSSEIRIRRGMDKREKMNTLLHECSHAIVYCYGLKNEFKDDEHEEKIINVLCNALTELLVRNPNLIKFIVQSV